jgi:Tfp pilus assembly protein PilN
MSAAVSLLLDAKSVRVVRDGRDATPSVSIAWSPDDPVAMADALRAHIGSPSAIVIVVGLGLLEIAEPDLPPMDLGLRRAVLWRDGDRYFPLDEPVAVACADTFAFAVPVRLLERWVRAIRTLGPVRAIVTAPQLCWRLIDTGAWALPAGENEQGVVRVRNGVLVEVRRELSDATGPASSDDASAEARNGGVSLADADAIGREALRWIDAPLDRQLLDVPHADSIRRARQRRWMASAMLAAAAVVVLAWSANRWRDAQLATLVSSAQQLSEHAAPALRAEARRSRALAETKLLADAEQRSRGPEAPLPVLAHLSRVLPRDVVVQRLEWNGQQWRVEGTADNAPRLVPLLDADTHFRDVRIAAASQRFLDAGRQRESFAISFRMRPVTGGARGTP